MATASAPKRMDDATFRRILQGRRVQERFAHLVYYLDEPPEASLRLGIALSEAAHRTRQRAEG